MTSGANQPTLPGIDASVSFVVRDGKLTPYSLGWFTKLRQILNGTVGVGFTGTITTAKLTGGGSNGSITFTNGVVTAQVAAT
jgi:hypothetical protein